MVAQKKARYKNSGCVYLCSNYDIALLKVFIHVQAIYTTEAVTEQDIVRL
jgi:hypothetical protein